MPREDTKPEMKVVAVAFEEVRAVVLLEGAMAAMRFVSRRRVKRDFPFVCHAVLDTALLSEPTNRLAVVITVVTRQIRRPRNSIQIQDGS